MSIVYDFEALHRAVRPIDEDDDSIEALLRLVREPDNVKELLTINARVYRWGKRVGLSSDNNKPYVLQADDERYETIQEIFAKFRDPEFRRAHGL